MNFIDSKPKVGVIEWSRKSGTRIVLNKVFMINPHKELLQ